jgi:hypothetical protein
MDRLLFVAQLVNQNGIPKVEASPDTLKTILTIAFTLIGAIAFLMLVITGFRYVLSQGEPNKLAELRRQILYLVFGLVLALSADLIVSFVIGKT